MKYKCIIIDDDRHFIELLEEYVEMVPELELIISFDDPVKAFTGVSIRDQVDIIFLDINMPNISGLHLATCFKARGNCKILIFTTAHAEYEVDAFDYDADLFLLKPFSFKRFKEAITPLLRKIEAIPVKSDHNNQFYFKSTDNPYKTIRCDYKDIIAIESSSNYVIIHTNNNSHKYLSSTKEMEIRLADKGNYMRVHRSFIVATDFIEEIEHNTTIILKKGKLKIPVGRAYKKIFTAFTNKRKL